LPLPPSGRISRLSRIRVFFLPLSVVSRMFTP
jgi:hypothetical protein